VFQIEEQIGERGAILDARRHHSIAGYEARRIHQECGDRSIIPDDRSPDHRGRPLVVRRKPRASSVDAQERGSDFLDRAREIVTDPTWNCDASASQEAALLRFAKTSQNFPVGIRTARGHHPE